jgi:hypothetical protein
MPASLLKPGASRQNTYASTVAFGTSELTIHTRRGIVAVGSLVELGFSDVNDRCGERVDPKLLVPIGRADGVERASRIQPAHMPDQTLFSKDQFLPAGAKFK